MIILGFSFVGASQCAACNRPSGDPAELAQGLERSLRDWRSRGGRLFSRDAANQYEEPVLRAQLASACLLPLRSKGSVPPRAGTHNQDLVAPQDALILAASHLSIAESGFNRNDLCGGTHGDLSTKKLYVVDLGCGAGPPGDLLVAEGSGQAPDEGASAPAPAAVLEWTYGTLAVCTHG